MRNKNKDDKRIEEESKQSSESKENSRRNFLKMGGVAAGGLVVGAVAASIGAKPASAQPSSTPSPQINEWAEITGPSAIVWLDSSGNAYVKDGGMGNQPGALIVNANVVTAYGHSLGAGTTGATSTTCGIQEALNA